MKTAPISVDYIQHCGSDLSVVNAARVSFHKESEWDRSKEEQFQKNGIPYELKLKDGDVKLIGYLAKHGHISPFHHAFITMRVKAPIFVARQLVKHKFMPWNEVSRRYVDEEPEFYFPDGWRAKAENVKQGSAEQVIDKIWWIPEDSWYSVKQGVVENTKICLYRYKRMISEGICPEQARMILPLNTMTEWIWSGTLSAWSDMLKLRLDPHTQLETQQVAQKAKAILEPLFPVSLKALLND